MLLVMVTIRVFYEFSFASFTQIYVSTAYATLSDGSEFMQNTAFASIIKNFIIPFF